MHSSVQLSLSVSLHVCLCFYCTDVNIQFWPSLSLSVLLQKNTKAPQAAGKIHTDFEKGFIMAEVKLYCVQMLTTKPTCGYISAAETAPLYCVMCRHCVYVYQRLAPYNVCFTVLCCCCCHVHIEVWSL